jgi:pantetheine-phosphate adenylyltransferase
MIELPKLKKNSKPRLGLYPGSFDPFHIGHMNILEQASEVFDKIIVAKGINSDKTKNTRYSLPENTFLKMGVGWTSYDSLLTEVVKSWEREYNVILIRGLRNGADLEYEQNLVAFLKGMHPVKVVAFYCEPQFRHVSSSALRGIENFSDEEYKKYVIKD